VLRHEYDGEADALYLTFTDSPVSTTEQLDAGTLVDLDQHGRVVGIEVIRPERLWPAALVIERYGLDVADRAMLEALYPVQVGQAGDVQQEGQELASSSLGITLELV
jgi:uncharacterized protein YuzE